MFRRLATTLLTLSLLSAVARAAEVPDLDKLAAQITKSLVLVEYTFKNENGSQEQFGQGIVLNKEGVILLSGVFLPDTVPHEWVTRLKVRVPAQRFQAVPATFLGRTANRMFAFIKTDSPIAAEPLDFSKTAPTTLGQTVYSAALLPKEGQYAPAAAVNHVKFVYRSSHEMAVTETFGLTRVNSPVFDAATGGLVGITFSGPGKSVLLRLGENVTQVEIKDDEQPGYYLTIADINASFDHIPTQPFATKRPWLGVEGVSGVDEDLRKDYKIEQAACVTIGAVIPGAAAERAGLKPQDVILTINGKEFSDSPVPEFAPAHFAHALERLHPGGKVTIGIVRRMDPDKTADHSGLERKQIELTMGAAPSIAADMPHTFDSAVGITTRDLVFTDTYTRHLPPEQKGVMVALVKQNSPAYISDTRLQPGYLITKVNDQDITDNQQFAKVIKAAESDPVNKQIVFLVIKPDSSTAVCRIDLSATATSPKPPAVSLPGSP